MEQRLMLGDGPVTKPGNTLLVVEDDPGDQELIRRSLDDDHLITDLHFVSDGEEALRYLRREQSFSNSATSPRPDLILLDLNMPCMNGRELLKVLKTDAELCRIPVVVLTTSEEETDVLQSYDLGCNSYIKKSVEMDQFVSAVRQLSHYWFGVVTLPTVQASTY